MEEMHACPGCGAAFSAFDGPTHPYMRASAACWAAFGDVLAREYQSPPLFAACHRLTVDAYALQHPGSSDDRRARQSLLVHFTALHAVFAHGATHRQAAAQMQRMLGRQPASLPPSPEWRLTVAHITATDHVADVRRWARHAYDRWAPLLLPLIAT